jgi:hypothetical protein
MEVRMVTHPPVASPRVAPPAATKPQAAPEPASKAFLAHLNIDFRQLGLKALVGGFGGLVGWLVYSLVSAFLPLDWLNVYVRNALVTGPLLGVCIGFGVGSTEGLFASRSMRRVLRGGGYGAALGAIGGVVGLVLGELIFNFARGGVWPRALGWGLFGIFVGISDGVAHKMPVKIRYGILGGLLGGFIGGGTYEGLVATIRGMGFRAEALAWGSAIGLVILGACIGCMVSVVETLLRKSWLFFLTGRLEGQTRTLDSSRPHTIGSDPGCTIVIPSDPSVAAVHAEITFNEQEEFVIHSREGYVVIRRDGVDKPVTSHSLCPGDRVVLGETRMIFRNVEAKKA